MAEISIIDSGYVSTNKIGTQETLLANSGSAITLKGVEISYSREQKLDNTPIVGTETNAVLNPVSITNPIITINGVLTRSESTDMNNIILFDTLVRSKGIKLVYYSSVDSDIAEGGTDGWNNIISELGYDNVNGNTNQEGSTVSDKHTQSGGELYNSGSPIPHLHVYIRGFRITQGSDKTIVNYTLTCEVT